MRAYAQSVTGDFPIDDLYLHEEIVAHGALEVGSAFCPKGKWHPGWEDKRGHQFAEVHPPDEMLARLPPTQYFLRIDDRPGWRWEDDEQ